MFGTVRDINLRTIVIGMPDGSIAYPPNGSVWKKHDYQPEEGQRRSSLSVEVAYDSDLDQVAELLAAAARSVDGVLTEPDPFAVVDESGDSSIEFKASTGSGRALHKNVSWPIT